MTLQKLKEKQETAVWNKFYNRIEPMMTYEEILSFISKVRKETAEAVCDEMMGKIKKEIYPTGDINEPYLTDMEAGYNWRIKHEKEIKKQILKII